MFPRKEGFMRGRGSQAGEVPVGCSVGEASVTTERAYT